MALIQKVIGTLNGSASPITPTLTGVVAGDTLVLEANGFGLNDTGAPTDSAGQTWSEAYFLTNTGLSIEMACYYLENANAGTHALSWTGSESGFCNYRLVEIPATVGIDVVGALAQGVNTITTLAATVTSVNPLDAVLAQFCAHPVNGTNPAGITDPPAGYVSIAAQQDTGGNAGDECCYKEVATAGVQNAAWTFAIDIAGSAYAAAMVTFKLKPPFVATALMGHGIFVNA